MGACFTCRSTQRPSRFSEDKANLLNFADRGRRPQARSADRREHSRSPEALGLGRETIASGGRLHRECDLDGRADHGEDRFALACTKGRNWLIAELSDTDLLSRMRNFEDHFVERKTSGDSKWDWLKTVVAFANSAPNGYPCVLYLGVTNSGEIESPQQDLDSLQRKFNREMEKVYPPVPYFPKIVNDDGRQALAVIVLGSQLRPHFAGPSFIRKGSESVIASAQKFAELIAKRSSKAYEILRFKGKPVTVVERVRMPGLYEHPWNEVVVVADCNQFWVTLQQSTGAKHSEPLDRVTLNFDTSRNRLILELAR